MVRNRSGTRQRPARRIELLYAMAEPPAWRPAPAGTAGEGAGAVMASGRSRVSTARSVLCRAVSAALVRWSNSSSSSRPSAKACCSRWTTASRSRSPTRIAGFCSPAGSMVTGPPTKSRCIAIRESRLPHRELLVQPGGLGSDAGPAEFGHSPLPAPRTERGGPVRVTDQRVDRRGERGIVAGRHEQAGDAVHHYLRDSADSRRDDRAAAGHRLEVDDAERLVLRWADEHGRVAEDLDHLGLGEHAGDQDDAAPARAQPLDQAGDLGLQLGRVGLARTQHELRRFVEPLSRPQQHRQALLPGNAADERDRRPARIDSVPVEHLTAWVGTVKVGVDSVVDDVHAIGGYLWIGNE